MTDRSSRKRLIQHLHIRVLGQVIQSTKITEKSFYLLEQLRQKVFQNNFTKSISLATLNCCLGVIRSGCWHQKSMRWNEEQDLFSIFLPRCCLCEHPLGAQTPQSDLDHLIPQTIKVELKGMPPKGRTRLDIPALKSNHTVYIKEGFEWRKLKPDYSYFLKSLSLTNCLKAQFWWWKAI